MVFAPPEPVDVWQHKRDIQNKSMGNASSSQPNAKLSTPSSEDLARQSSTATTATRRPAPGETPAVIHRKPTRMATIKDNVWMGRTNDGQDRSHIAPISMKIAWLRIAQMVLALVYLILAAFAAYTLNMSTISGFAFSFFVFSWTVVYFVWMGVSILQYPIVYHWIAHIAVEALTNIFWLASWATFASYASAINLPGAGRSVGRQQVGLGQATATTTSTTTLASNAAAAVLAAEIAIAVNAAIGAIIWVLFCFTLLMTVVSILQHRNASNTKPSKGKDPEMSGAIPE